MRCAILTLSVVCLVSLANAQEQEHDPADPSNSSIAHGGIAHHEEMIGQTLPDVTFAGNDGNEVSLGSFRGKPLLIDLWGTWCAPCLAAMPSLSRIYAEVKDKGMEFITFDEVGDPVDEDKDSARATSYLARHHYDWKNFHDTDRKMATALQADGLPLVLVIDANGKVIYFAFGGNEADLRRAIAGLGPQFASVAPSGEGKRDTPQNSPNQN